MKPLVGIIAAMTEDGVIGQDNRIPWFYVGDLKRFRGVTIHQTVVMGRKTLNSIGRALPERANFVLSRDKTYSTQEPECWVYNNLQAAIKAVRTPFCWIIGGAEIYKESLIAAAADLVDITVVPFAVSGGSTVCFPKRELEKYYKLQDTRSHPHDESLKILRYIRK